MKHRKATIFLALLLLLSIPAFAESSQSSYDGYVDVPQNTGRDISQYIYLVDAKMASEINSDIDSVEYARRAYIASQVERPYEKALKALKSERRVTNQGNELDVEYGGYDRNSDVFMFTLKIDMEITTSSLQITIPGKYIADESRECYQKDIDNYDTIFKSGNFPFIFDITYTIDPGNDLSFNIIFNKIEIWNKESGTLAIGAYNIKGNTIEVKSYKTSMIDLVGGIAPSALHAPIKADDSKFLERHPYGMTRSFASMTNEIAPRINSEVQEANKARYSRELSNAVEKGKRKALSKPDPKIVEEEITTTVKQVKYTEKEVLYRYPMFRIEAVSNITPDGYALDTLGVGGFASYNHKGFEAFTEILYDINLDSLDIIGGIGGYTAIGNIILEGGIGASYLLPLQHNAEASPALKRSCSVLPMMRMGIGYHAGFIDIGLETIMAGEDTRIGITCGYSY